MAGLTYEQQTQVREAIQTYLSEKGMTTLREIAEFVEAETGIKPSLATISRKVKEAGYERPVTIWRKGRET